MSDFQEKNSFLRKSSKNSAARIEINRQKNHARKEIMIKPQFESYRYVGEVCRLKSQSIVECRLPGSEINGVLAVHAQAVPGESVCSDGEVQYGGRVLLCIVYEDGDKKICRAERGAEFFHKAEDATITPSCFAKTSLETENVAWRREGSGLYISVVVDAMHAVYGSKQMEYLTGGEGLTVKKGTAKISKTVCVSGETEGEDEFDTDYVGDILLHSERAVVGRVNASGGQIDVEGELALHICVLKNDDSLCSYERLIPFKMSVPSEEAFGNVTAGARVQVKSARLSAGADEEKGASHVVLSYCLAAECYLSVQDEISVATDAFSTACEVSLKRQKEGGRYLTNQFKGVERISGVAVLSPEMDGEYALQAAVLPRAEITVRKGERGMEAEGAVMAEVLLCSADGLHRKSTLTLPFVFPVDHYGEEIEVDCIVCGLNVRRKKSGETEAEATLKLAFRAYEPREWEYISETTEGETYAENDSAFSVFMTEAGEDLWQVAKRLRCLPEDLKKSNPGLEFPLKSGERLFVYRQLKE